MVNAAAILVKLDVVVAGVETTRFDGIADDGPRRDHAFGGGVTTLRTSACDG
jgi:hypothetical protein